MERIPAYQILVGGKDLPDSYYNKIEQVIYEEPEDGEAYFEIHFADHDSSILDGGKFKKDKTNCALFMGYVGEMDFLMDGIVSGIAPDYPQNDAPTLKITVKNASVKMNSKSVNCAWKGKTYSQIAKAIAKKYGLEAIVDDTGSIFKANNNTTIYQAGMSDYMFLSVCARKIGYIFRISYNTLIFQNSVKYDDTVYLDYRVGGCNLLSFRPNADSTNKVHQYYSNNVEFSNNNPQNDYGVTNVSRAKPNTSKKVKTKTYKVKKGDYLIKIAKTVYGDGSRYIDIYNANSKKIKMPGYVLSVGQVLKIP